MPSGSHRLEPTRERKRARPGSTESAGNETKMRRRIVRERERGEGKRESERITWRERDRGWNIANHRISILMLRGGAVVNVEGATWWL